MAVGRAAGCGGLTGVARGDGAAAVFGAGGAPCAAGRRMASDEWTQVLMGEG